MFISNGSEATRRRSYHPSDLAALSMQKALFAALDDAEFDAFKEAQMADDQGPADAAGGDLVRRRGERLHQRFPYACRRG